MRTPPIGRLARLPGTTLLGAFLLATLGLSAWLAYQAMDAYRSHRRTAEATLRDHASISAVELSRRARNDLDDVLDDAFEGVYRRLRRGRVAPVEAAGWGLDEAARDQRCRCPALRDPVGLFRAILPARELSFEPSDLPSAAIQRVAERILTDANGPGRRGEGFLVVDEPEIAPEPVVVGYTMTWDESDEEGLLYGFMASTEAMAQLFDTWYGAAPLLPQPIAGDLPNDSLLTVSVRSLDSISLYTSPAQYDATFAAADTLGPDFGNFVVQAAIRPDAASRLVIGGLPKSRLPLLAILFLLTLGVGGAALLQVRRERELALLRDDFISGVSHELRTPLAQIRMFAELQEAGVLSSQSDRDRSAGVINREARRLSHLVENILQYSRLRRAPAEGPLRESVDVDEVLRESVEAVESVAGSRGIEIRVEGDRGSRVLANRTALSQILVNLLDNAIKYGPPGQVVTARVEADEHRVRFVVDDEGPGIPPRDRERIWEPYRRLPREVSSRLPGTGIGLAVVARLTHIHGGEVGVHEAPAGGARFVVELPPAPTLAALDGPTDEDARSRHAPRSAGEIGPHSGSAA